MPNLPQVAIAGLSNGWSWESVGHWSLLHGLQIAAAADPDPGLRERARLEYPIPRVYPTPQEMLAREDFHFLHISIEGPARTELVERAASRGIHVLLQPPMAHSLESAIRMLDACRSNETQILVNWPLLWNPAVAHAGALVREGAIGPLLQVWQRLLLPPSNPVLPVLPPNSRSASILLQGCGTGINLCRTIIGVPKFCTAVAATLERPPHPIRPDSTERSRISTPGAEKRAPRPKSRTGGVHGLDWQGALDEMRRQEQPTPKPRTPRPPAQPAPDELPHDHAIVILNYGSALATIEASRSQPRDEGTPDIILRGTGGSLLIRGERLQQVGSETAKPIDIPVPPLPEERQNGPAQLFGAALQEAEFPDSGSGQISRDTQEILEASPTLRRYRGSGAAATALIMDGWVEGWVAEWEREPNTQHPTPNTQHPTPNTQHPTPIQKIQ